MAVLSEANFNSKERTPADALVTNPLQHVARPCTPVRCAHGLAKESDRSNASILYTVAIPLQTPLKKLASIDHFHE